MEPTPLRLEGGALRLHVWVVPGASRSRLVGPHGDKMKIQVSSPAEAGRANDEVAQLLKLTLGASVELVMGMRSRHKVFEIAGRDVPSLRRKLGIPG